MTPSVLREVQRLPISLPEAWSFFSDPRNLPRITPPSLGLEVTSDLPGKMYPGMIITYRVRPIPGVSGGVGHGDHPRAGAGRCSSTSSGSAPTGSGTTSTTSGRSKGGVEMEDIVHYALPLGTIGRVFGGPLVRRRLEQIFSFRRRFLAQEFGPGLRG